MNMKNAAILLIFLLAVMGLIIGVYYSEVDNIEKTSQKSKTVIEESNGTLTFSLEKTSENSDLIDKYFT